MSIKNAPTKWKQISEAAEACGAGQWAMRKWLERREIPAAWKLRIIAHTNGALALDDFEMSASNLEAAE